MDSRTVVDRPLAVVNAVNTATPATYWVSVDHLNRPVKMTTATKTSVWDAIWQPWGGIHAITGSASLDARFPGQWFQTETGLHYNWHRSYDPTLGRYTQPDPLGFVDGPSVYGYAGGSPMRSVDRDGLFAGPLFPPTTTLPLPPSFPLPFPDIFPNPSDDPGPLELPPGATPEIKSDHDQYKRICNQKPPAGLTLCESWRWQHARNVTCERLRKEWDDKYEPGRHDNDLEELRKSIDKLRMLILKHCKLACYAR